MGGGGRPHRRGASALGAVLATCLLALPAAADPAGYRFYRSADGGSQPRAYWNPCRRITYGIDFTYARRAGMRVAWERARWKSAVAEIGAAMDVRFRYAGAIRSRSAGRFPTSEADVDIVITFGRATRGGRYGYRRVLKGPVAGVGGVSWRPSWRPGRWQLYDGYVVIDAHEVMRRTDGWRVRFDDRPVGERPTDVARSLYVHEFGHAVGLDHVRDRDQVMYATVQPSRPDALGAGDRRGLRLLGRQRCL